MLPELWESGGPSGGAGGCQERDVGVGEGSENRVNGADSSAKFFLFGVLIVLNVLFRVIIIYTFSSNCSFLLTRGGWAWRT